MKDIFRILLISLLSFTIISCSKKDESPSSSSSSITLSDIDTNLTNKIYFVSNKNSSSSSRELSKRNNYVNSQQTTNTKSLVVIDKNNNIDYGVISNYSLNIQHVIFSKNNEYAYLVLDYRLEGSQSDLFIQSNCPIIQVNLSNKALTCIGNGLKVRNQDDFLRVSKRYQKVFQNDSLGNVAFVSNNDIFSDGLNNCDEYCLFRYELSTNKFERLSLEKKEVEQFKMLEDGKILYTDHNPVDSSASGIKIWDNGVTKEYSKGGTNFETGNNNTIIYSGELSSGNTNSDKIVLIRVKDGIEKKTYTQNPTGGKDILAFVFSDDGDVYAHFPHEGLFSIFPLKSTKIVSTYFNFEECQYELTCYFNFVASSGIIFYTKRLSVSGKRPFEIIAVKKDGSETKKIISPNDDCSNYCYSFQYWVSYNKEINLIMKDLNNGKTVMFKINANTFDFSSNQEQYEMVSKIDDYLNNKEIASVNSINLVESNSPELTAEINHEDNDTNSIRILFNNKMDYSDVESKVKIIDNSSNNEVGFIPLWNNKTLHLVVDTDNGTVFDYNDDPLTSGTTYKVTILGTAKDSDGNALGSDVVKYITP